jgi:hypothetical protein
MQCNVSRHFGRARYARVRDGVSFFALTIVILFSLTFVIFSFLYSLSHGGAWVANGVDDVTAFHRFL